MAKKFSELVKGDKFYRFNGIELREFTVSAVKPCHEEDGEISGYWISVEERGCNSWLSESAYNQTVDKVCHLYTSREDAVRDLKEHIQWAVDAYQKDVERLTAELATAQDRLDKYRRYLDELK